MAQSIMLAISTDRLIFMKNKKEIGTYLIHGKDNNGFIVEGDIEPMMKIIHRCFQAREQNSPVKFNIDGVDIIFK